MAAKSCFVFALILIAQTLPPGAATTAPSGWVQQRANDVAAEFRSDPGGYDALFAPGFLKALPAKKIDALFVDLFKKLGPCKSVSITDKIGPNAAKVEYLFNAFAVSGTVSVDKSEQHLIDGLYFSPPAPLAENFDSIVKSLKALPGTTALSVVQIDGQTTDTGQIQVLASLNPDQPLAIGSAFKLYILAELVRQIDAGERHWEDVVKLNADHISMPSGTLHAWPIGSPLTLHTLASLMISQSDNTATDQLLHIVGRENVEAMLEPAGNQHADRNKPFLATIEMFKLHSNKALGDAFVAGDLAARRKLLETAVKEAQVDPAGTGPGPARFEQIEWFASTADLCRAMAYLKAHSESGDGAKARQILGINPGLSIDKSRFPVICYKGGSEPGVLNLTFLLKSQTEHWYAFSATWNNPKAALDESKLFTPIQQAFRLLP